MKTNSKVIALGGIQEKNLKKLTLTKSDGFAGIRYFEQKKAPHKIIRGFSKFKLN